jgi:hypothetical protein
MFELVFIDRLSSKVTYAITQVAVVRWVTQSEVGMTMLDGRLARCSFKNRERLEINRKDR